MAIRFVTGDLLRADAEALVNAVNTDGVMGKGIALQFKRAYPSMFKAYAIACKDGLVKIGKVHVFELATTGRPRCIINFPTKLHWRSKSRLADIAAGLDDLAVELASRDIRSVAIPPLGCGLGGLQWTDVLPLIQSALTRVSDVDSLIYAPETGAEAAPAKGH